MSRVVTPLERGSGGACDLPDRRVDALVLDFDGTIVDSEWTEYVAWQELYDDLGFALDSRALAEHAGAEDSVRLPARRLAGLLGRADREVELFQWWRERSAELLEQEPLRQGIRGWLGEAAGLGLAVGVATSSPRDPVVRYLEARGIFHMVDVLATGDEVTWPKPAPDVYELALRRLTVSPRRALALEDSVHGAAAAQSAGCRVVVSPNRVTARQPWPDYLTVVDIANDALRGVLAGLPPYAPAWTSNLNDW